MRSAHADTRKTGRVLIVPAAGRGSRLPGSRPKPLVDVAGRAMLARVLDLYAQHVDRACVVVHPDTSDAIRHAIEPAPMPVTWATQAEPTGMLDAIVAARDAIAASEPQHVWITWCDQVAIHPRTVEGLASLVDGTLNAAMVMPTATVPDPYIHFERNAAGRIVAVRQRREGDVMPAVGETDAGLFSLTASAYFTRLRQFARGVSPGQGTGERNFLPFIPWLAARADVETFPVDAIEAVGVNSPEDLARIAAHLAARTVESQTR